MADHSYFTIAPRTFKAKGRQAYVKLGTDAQDDFNSEGCYSIATYGKELKHLRETGVPLRFFENDRDTKRNVTFAITCQGACAGLTAAPTSANTATGVVGSTAQVETATVVGTVSTAGYAKLTLTSAILPVGQNPRIINVLLAASDDADAVATKIRAALSADTVIPLYFTVTGATSAVILTSKKKLANDATLNLAIANGGNPASAVATSSCAYEVWDIDGKVMAPTDTTTNKHIFPCPEGFYYYRVSRAGWNDILGRFAVLGAAVTETKLMTAYR